MRRVFLRFFRSVGMFKVGDLVIYSCDGVCRVESVGLLDVAGASKERLYYTLAPVYRPGKIFSPVDSGVFMRHVISREEAERLILAIPEAEGEVCDNRNIRFLSEHYQERMQRHDCLELVKVIKAVHQKRVAAMEKGKKLGQIDERYRKRAEDMLYGELAVALGIPRDSVVSYITERVDASELARETV